MITDTLHKSFSGSKKREFLMVFFFIGVEVLFSALFIFNIRFLSDSSRSLNFVSPIGISISLATLVGAQALLVLNYFYARFSKDKVELDKKALTTKVENPYFWIFFTAVVFVLVEILNILSLQLGAPLTERELVQRVIIICVTIYLGSLLFGDKIEKVGLIGIFLTFIPTVVVLIVTDSNQFEIKSWFVVSLISAVFLGLKRIGARSITTKLSHYKTMIWSGSLTLIGFIILGFIFKPSLEFFLTNIWVFLSMFLIVPFITISRQLVYKSGLNTTLHESLVYIGTLIILTTEKLISPNGKVLLSPFWLLVSIGISILAAYCIVSGIKKSKVK